MNQIPVIRVSRKRSADPHDALIVQIKKTKHVDPVVFQLFKTIEPGNQDQDLNGVHIVDLPKKQSLEKVEERMEDGESSSSGGNPLAFVNDEAIGVVGGEKEDNVKQKQDEEQIVMNGRRMVPAPLAQPESTEDDLVFDYYRVSSNNNQNVALYSNEFLENQEITEECFDVRFTDRYGAELVSNQLDGEESDAPADDDEDSNDEDNWRNDYPDEDSYSDEDAPDDFYGELTTHEWHEGENSLPDDGIQRRFENFCINDRFESYFEGEDTEDEEF